MALVLAASSCSSGDPERADGDGSTTTGLAADWTVPPRYAGFHSETYADESNWVCHPDSDDICDGGLDTTVVAEDGTTTIERWQPASDPGIDCFYVYPTISKDPGPISDMEPSDDEEGFAALNQVARLGERCRVFAPVYRQGTLSGLASRFAGDDDDTTDEDSPGEDADGDDESDAGVGFRDVTEAWSHYMANHNQGRGVVLIGHSQGAAMLNQLIVTEFDPNPEIRDLLVSAYLAGWAVRVPDGADVGGDFEHVPLCRDPDQVGCVVTWASFRSTEPPSSAALFGRPFGGEGAAGCNHPAALAGGAAELDSRFPSNPDASILSALGAEGGRTGWIVEGGDAASIETPFVSTPGLLRGECVERDGFHYLEVTVQPGDGPRVDDIGGDLGAEWGLHLQDVNLVMGDIVTLVGSQSEAWRDAHD